MATKLEQRMAAERMAEDERGSKGKATAQIPASSEQKRKLKELGLTGVLTVVPGGFILKGVKGASKVYKTIAAARKAAEAAGKKVSEVSKLTPQKGEAARLRNLNRAQTLKKKPRGEPAYKTLKREESREVAERTSKLSKKKQAENLRKLKEEQNKSTPPSKPTPSSKPKMSNAGKGVAALTATATGVGGLASLNKKKKEDKKLKPVPEVNVRTLPKPKKVRSAPKKGDNEELNINPKRQKPPKVKKSKEADDGYRFYGKEGTGLGDFSRKYGIKYATQEQFEKDFGNVDGAYEGGSLKKLAKKKRKGFSGRGAGKALRGF